MAGSGTHDMAGMAARHWPEPEFVQDSEQRRSLVSLKRQDALA